MSTEPYTPTTEQMRAYVDEAYDGKLTLPFDRWFAAGILKAQADAWDEGLGAGCDRWADSREFGEKPVNPYRNV